MNGGVLHLVVPEPRDRRTGGSIYDARMADGLRRRGWVVEVHGVGGVLPIADAQARASLSATLAALPDGVQVVIDGLAMAGLPDVIRGHAGRLRVLALVHLLLADEPGLAPDQRERLLELEGEALAGCALVIVTSAFTAERMRGIGVDPAVVRIVRPGTDPAPAAIGPGDDAPPRLLCVASVTPGKGQDVLVRALAGLTALAWECVCVGDLTRSPDFAHEVRAMSSAAGLSGRIAFTGELDEDAVDELYRTSSIFVSPSRYEGYGMALTEAMAHGLPIVATTGGAIPWTVPTEVGVLVPPGDDEALAAALRRLLMDTPEEPRSARQRRTRLAEASRRTALGLPSWDDAVDAFAEAVGSLGVRPDAASHIGSGPAAAKLARFT
jgi:glycosyltransferase involved in cell wall biosynthesis